MDPGGVESVVRSVRRFGSHRLMQTLFGEKSRKIKLSFSHVMELLLLLLLLLLVVMVVVVLVMS